MNALEKLFATKKTENGDISYNTTGNPLIDILFMTAYFEKHIEEVRIGNTEKEKLFSMFIRDPRYGLGRRDLGRRLMDLSNVQAKDIVKAGRFDDLWHIPTVNNVNYLLAELRAGDELAKKWMPRLTTKNKDKAKAFCKLFGISEKEYRKLIKSDTTENKLSRHRTEEINFEHVPSLAMIKYYKRFLNGEDTQERFKSYLDSVKKGESKLNISTANVYDIYRNREKIDADLYFDKLEKIKISCLPIIDTSGSMHDNTDSIGKALSIGHYLSKCSTYYKDYFITFSESPELVHLEGSDYNETINLIKRAKWQMNTDFGKVMKLLEGLNELPDYLVVLSDMEFDRGSNKSKKDLQRLWNEKGYKTKIVWWNFNNRNKTVPELDEMGNIFISGYSPMMLKYLEAGFDANTFLDKLLEEYKKNLEK